MAYLTDKTPGFDRDPFFHPLDAILADIAIAVQLPPGLHAKACERYEAVRTYAERSGSPLEGHILRFYPQGSMAIDATISIRGTDDEYDLDIIAALAVAPGSPRARYLTSFTKQSSAILRARRSSARPDASRSATPTGCISTSRRRSACRTAPSARATSSTPIRTIRRGCISMSR
jgi:hypothetical protein